MSDHFHIPGEQTARFSTHLPADRNRAQAIAEVTKLPVPVWAKGLPHANSVSWALWVARKHRFDTLATLVLVALAQHAAASLFSGDGYRYTTAEDVALLTNEPVHRVRRELEPRYHVWPHVEDRCDAEGNVLGWRIPEDALNGNWLDRAARREHYGQANNHREEGESPHDAVEVPTRTDSP